MSPLRASLASRMKQRPDGGVAVTDARGRTDSDELARFTRHFLLEGFALEVPQYRAQHFFGGVTGLVLFRDPPFQVELFLAEPNVVVPPHRHPNVDSYEVFLRGVELTHENQTVISRGLAAVTDVSGLPRISFFLVRVRPNELHGGRAGPEGGAFLSVQHWRNGILPTSVGTDWEGETMGDSHSILAGLSPR